MGELHDGRGRETHSWRRVIWLTGVHSSCTLGDQLGIALLAAGALAPLATSVLVLVTRLGALPISAQVARRSYAGQGSIAMLENLLPGWTGKLLVLVLLGVAVTDCVITMTLSAADATKHAIENPYLHPFLGDAQTGVTPGLLALLAVVFRLGCREAIGMAIVVAVLTLLLNLVVLVRGLVAHPEGELREYQQRRRHLCSSRPGPRGRGASRSTSPAERRSRTFETGVSVMPLIDGGASDAQPPAHNCPGQRE